MPIAYHTERPRSLPSYLRILDSDPPLFSDDGMYIDGIRRELWPQVCAAEKVHPDTPTIIHRGGRRLYRPTVDILRRHAALELRRQGFI
jgi:hypothetical protein